MGDRSRIEWTEATWNPVTGCSKVSPGCAHCYAETVTARFAGSPGWISEHRPWTPENAEHNVRLHSERLEQPLRWRRPRMVFVNSMSDLFHELVPDEFIDRVFAVMGLASMYPRRHTFQVLTKRPERALAYLTSPSRKEAIHDTIDGSNPIDGGGLDFKCPPDILRRLASSRNSWHPYFTWPLPNVWVGVSIESARYTWRADVLREIPAAVRFISAEPLLGSLFKAPSTSQRDDADAARRLARPARDPEGQTGIDPDAPRGVAPLDLTGIDWLIVGGESGGRDARPMHPQWARELRDAALSTGERCFSCRWHPIHEQHRCFHCRDRRREGGTAFFFKQWGSWRPTSWPLDDGMREEDAALGGAVRYAGASAKSGGRLLDGREWNEMPMVKRREAA